MKLKALVLALLFLATDVSFAAGEIDLTKLRPGKNIIELGWTDMPQCSKIENEEAKGQVLVCHDGGQNCDWWGCIPNAPSCGWEIGNLGFQVPVPYVADQKGYAYAELNLPQVPDSIDDLKSDVNAIIDNNLKNALRNHFNNKINSFSNDIKTCVIAASAGGVVNGIVTGGSAALPTFMAVLNPCADSSVNRLTTDLFNVSGVLQGALNNTSNDLKNYFSNMTTGGVNVYATSTCTNWRKL